MFEWNIFGLPSHGRVVIQNDYAAASSQAPICVLLVKTEISGRNAERKRDPKHRQPREQHGNTREVRLWAILSFKTNLFGIMIVYVAFLFFLWVIFHPPKIKLFPCLGSLESCRTVIPNVGPKSGCHVFPPRYLACLYHQFPMAFSAQRHCHIKPLGSPRHTLPGWW